MRSLFDTGKPFVGSESEKINSGLGTFYSVLSQMGKLGPHYLGVQRL